MFVYDYTGLSGSKTDLNPIGGGDPTKFIQAANDWNPLVQAAIDLRAAVISGSYHGFAPMTSSTNLVASLSGGLYRLYVSSSGDLFLHKPNSAVDILLSSSAGTYLPLSGGTLTGDLTGASGEFTGIFRTVAGGLNTLLVSGSGQVFISSTLSPLPANPLLLVGYRQPGSNGAALLAPVVKISSFQDNSGGNFVYVRSNNLGASEHVYFSEYLNGHTVEQDFYSPLNGVGASLVQHDIANNVMRVGGLGWGLVPYGGALPGESLQSAGYKTTLGAQNLHWNGAYSTFWAGAKQTLSTTGTPAIDPTLGDTVVMTLTGNLGIWPSVSGGYDGMRWSLTLKQDATGSRLIGTPPANLVWTVPGSASLHTVPVLSTGSNKCDIFFFQWNSTVNSHVEYGRSQNI